MVFFVNTGADRDRAAADLACDRRTPPHARARAHARALDRRVAAASTPAAYWLDATAAFVVITVALGDLRGRRVLPRAGAPGARRRDRARPPARPLLRRALALVGARRHRRPGSRRLHARGGAVRALAARGRGAASSPRSARFALERCVPERFRRIPRAEPERRRSSTSRPRVERESRVEWRTCR